MATKSKDRIAPLLAERRVREVTRLDLRCQAELVYDLIVKGGPTLTDGSLLLVEPAPGPLCRAPGLRRPQIVMVDLPDIFRSWLATGGGTVTLKYVETQSGHLGARLKCQRCQTTWTHTVLPRKQLPSGYWKCPHGCNDDRPLH